MKHLQRLLREILSIVPPTQFIVDGLDQFPQSEQTSILRELISLSDMSGSNCRILFSSRESAPINRILGGKPTISLREERDNIQKDIASYVHASLWDLRMLHTPNIIDNIESHIISNAGGKWNLLAQYIWLTCI
jgi:hypothetical protein